MTGLLLAQVEPRHAAPLHALALLVGGDRQVPRHDQIGPAAYGQFIQPKSNLAAEHSLRIACQAAFSRLTGRRPDPILRISLASSGEP